METEAEKLWNAVTNGIVRIFKTAVDMVKVSADFFAFFLQFKHSFQYYQSNQDKSLMVSLQHLRDNVAKFTDFKDDFSKKVQQLNVEAMTCIRQCVETQIGAENFQNSLDSHQSRQQLWMEQKNEYDVKSISLDKELDKLKVDNVVTRGEKARLELKVECLKQSLEHNTIQLKSCKNMKAELDKMII